MLTAVAQHTALVAMLTYLIVDSVLLDKPRQWYGRYYLPSCYWCTSAWIAAATTAATQPPHPVAAWAWLWWTGIAAYLALQWLAKSVAET